MNGIGDKTLQVMRRMRESGGMPSDFARRYRGPNPISLLIDKGLVEWDAKRKLYVLTGSGEGLLRDLH